MAATLSVRPNRLSGGYSLPSPPHRRTGPVHFRRPADKFEPWTGSIAPSRLALAKTTPAPVRAGSRADDSAPFEMSVESALKLLGVSEGASFDDILRAKNSIVAACKDDQEAIAQVLFFSFLARTILLTELKVEFWSFWSSGDGGVRKFSFFCSILTGVCFFLECSESEKFL